MVGSGNQFTSGMVTEPPFSPAALAVMVEKMKKIQFAFRSGWGFSDYLWILPKLIRLKRSPQKWGKNNLRGFPAGGV